MSVNLSVAASLLPSVRQDIGIQVVSCSQPVSYLADKHQVSRKFVYQQGNKAQQSLDESFAPSQGNDDVLFHLLVTQNWLYQLILGLVLICNCPKLNHAFAGNTIVRNRLNMQRPNRHDLTLFRKQSQAF